MGELLQVPVGVDPPFKIEFSDEYPLRYVATNKPGVVIAAREPSRRGGEEWAVLHHAMPNRADWGITDGVFVSVVSYQDRFLVLECYACGPGPTRPVMRFDKHYRYDEWWEAVEAGWEWYAMVKPWCDALLL